VWTHGSLRHKYLKSDLNLICSCGLVVTGKVRRPACRGHGFNLLPIISSLPPLTLCSDYFSLKHTTNYHMPWAY